MSQDRPNSRTITSTEGMQVTVVDRGAALQSIRVNSRDGVVPVVVAYESTDDYRRDPFYLGPTVGPVANRIAGASFTLDDVCYALDCNEAERGNCLHGGVHGLHARQFDLELDEDARRIDCRLAVADGADGFPGTRQFRVSYWLIDDRSLAVEFVAETDRDTHVNLANHAYFNLGGALDDHHLRVDASAYTPLDEAMVPTGDVDDVTGTPFDLRRWQRLGHRSFDQNFVLNGSGDEPRLAAQLRCPASDLTLSVLTTQPGLQVYTGDFLADPFEPRQGICFEAQGFPDAPNQPGFPPTRLSAGETYRQTTIYRFESG